MTRWVNGAPREIRTSDRLARGDERLFLLIEFAAGVLRRDLVVIVYGLPGQKESRIVEGHLMPDQVHMRISIPPKYAVAHVAGYLKGRCAIQVARLFGGRKHNITGEHFWARGYFVSTVVLDDGMLRAYWNGSMD